jgi:hypothetical protein
MDLLEKIGDGYLMQLMKMKVLASAKFSPATILYKVRLNFPTTGIFTTDLLFRWTPATKGLSTTACCCAA